MKNIDKIIIDYLNTSYGENPDFVATKLNVYNPYVFANEERIQYDYNGRYFCRVIGGDVEFNTPLLITIVTLFDVELMDVHHLIEEWFNSKIFPHGQDM